MALDEAQPLRVSGVRHCTLLKWRPIVFLESPPDSCVCAVCRAVLGIKALGYRRYSCGHILCKRCVKLLPEDCGSGCPFDPDAQAVLGTGTDAQWEASDAELRALKVFCVNARHGCEFIGRLDRLPYHLQQSCEHNEVPCPSCGGVLPHKDVWHHRKWSCLAILRVLNEANAGASSERAPALKAVVQEYLEHARAVRGKLALLLNRENVVIGGLASGHSNVSLKSAPPMEVMSQATVPGRSENIECSLLVEIPLSLWHENPGVPSASGPAGNPATRDAVDVATKTSVTDGEVCCGSPGVQWADGHDATTLGGFCFKLRPFRADLGSFSCYRDRTTKFVVFELLVQPRGNVVGESGDAGLHVSREVNLILKHPCGQGDAHDLRLQTCNCACALEGSGGAKRWVRKALTTPVEWAAVREFVMCGQVEIVMRFA